VPEVRRALLDYYASVVRFDALIGRVVDRLAADGVLDKTVIVCCGDNGWQMPRGLGAVYDAGSRVPFVVRWPGRVKAGRVIDDFVSLTDLAPTFLELAGLRPLPEMTGRSFVDLLTGKRKGPPRDAVFLERERHANVRQDNASYPVRAIRTRDFLYIRNLRPDRWPAGDPKLWFAVGDYGDVDDSLAKQFVLAHADEPACRKYYEWSFAKRPAEELYDLRADPDQLVNVAGQARYAAVQRKLRQRLDDWMRQTADPRVDPACDVFDTYPYLGNPVPGAPGTKDSR
jgi:arylsulfatase A-like enzyme